jgi:hypothetical protein
MSAKDSFTKLNYGGSKVIQRVITGREFNKNEIIDYVKHFQDKYKHKNYTLMLGIETPIGFRNSKSFNINDEPLLIDDYEWEFSNGFVIYFWNSKKTSGGNNPDNDCLFECILKLCSIYRLPKDLKTDKELKHKLGLKDNDKIDIIYIPKIEKLFKININITGDAIYTSSNKFNQTIHLTLINEHYEIVEGNLKSKDLIRNIPFKEQKLIKVTLEKENVKCYDGDNTFYITYEEYYEKKNDFHGDNVYLDKLPIDDYHEFINECNLLKELTHGKIDLSRSGYKIVNEALKCVHFSLLSFNEPEELDLLEQNWIINTFKGGLIFSDEDKTLHHAFLYDKISAYPSMLCDDHISFPVKQGVFKSINELPEILNYGIYRCIIERCDDENINKLFRFNNKNYYTHFDINTARTLKLKINLIKDEEANALLYLKDRLAGSITFRQIVHELFELRKKSKLAKLILNTIWGSLCERNKIKTSTVHGDVNLNNGELLIEMKPINKNNDNHKISYLKHGKYFKHNYARFGVFLTSAVRKYMSELIYPIKENVHRCHTDSILSTIKLQYIPTKFNIGKSLGDFKLEKEGKCFLRKGKKPEFI